MERSKSEKVEEPDAIQHAIEYGVDITLLKENLKLTPTERLKRAQYALESLLAFTSQVNAFRAKRGAP